ncbi:aminotransferase class I/II-fold pyridoxal phosphate-dependent enzyme [Corynebacterium kalinowskii]|uniref:aminotransferase class I/II-fold pyridoxal phosphate-dependent enzyme n=1 Tax=Corynebacterium kalinowskii TaxID=2675216 RepID=UPI0018CCDA83|nr:aminotransferase class I/II-fold pyridoxal phosphate-dependent enzyme [Corynebacterium kalinowskii]
MALKDLTAEQFAELKTDIQGKYDELKSRNLKLNLTRGKPSSEQLDICTDLLSLPGENFIDKDGTDCRNYGNLVGLTSIREIWAEVLGVEVKNLIAADSSSLNIMFDLISWSYIWGNNDSEKPWKDEGQVKWICPVPGYDRHFTITEHFGFEMITVPMTPIGPDMDQVEELVKDPQVKGMWVVPMFGNPTGVTFDADTINRLVTMETAAPDFRVVWDNAYAIHTLDENFPEITDVVKLGGNRFWSMSSTSKITQAGAGVAFFNSSDENLTWYNSHALVRGIGPNKINQLAHAQFFGDAEGVKQVMRKHARSLAPKFAKVLEILESRLGEYGVAEWTKPTGGYFISLDVVPGTAKRVVELAKDAGIALTAAGASFPYGNDPENKNIRLAPSLPPVEELEIAMDGVATCVLLAALEQ